MFGASSAFGACHSCQNWCNNSKRSKTTKRLAKAWCKVKRTFTGRKCCTKNCPENYQEAWEKSFALCEGCGKHHICNTCKSYVCLTHNVCHACEKAAEAAKKAEETKKN